MNQASAKIRNSSEIRYSYIFSREPLHDKPNRHWFFSPQFTFILTEAVRSNIISLFAWLLQSCDMIWLT
ncbi:MAG: hypothetical protein QGG39_13040, partial [Candidatus Poribacteria bacterium]|nr:hypothetical protein [Candidatus Poribacteria bacterium]